ncbi:MAG TPA: YcnI family protein [Herbaspirillum sp.]
MFSFPIRALASAAALTLSASAFAHITLANPQASAGSYYKADFNVPHGCKGSATLKIRVRIPEGVIAVKPQPKAGWKIDIVEGAYPKTYTLHGAQIASGVREVSWTGKLPDAYFDDFVLQAYLTPDLPVGAKVYFPVVQECEKGTDRWIDLKEPSSMPAPHVTLVPKS